MKEIVVISGKGGTGKTSITAALAYLGANDVTLADCDVDAADMHLLMQPDFAESTDFYSGQVAEINMAECRACNVCIQSCRFDAIAVKDGQYVVDPISCEGCGYCAHVCPQKAITMQDSLVGQWYLSKVKTGTQMVHARLGIGADNSGKLVAHVKNEAKKIADQTQAKYVLVDGSPGIGCPVVSSLSGAHFVVLVTEPSVSGVHDLKRVIELVQKFKIPAGCIINKSDLNEPLVAELEIYLQQVEIPVLAKLPYDEQFTKAMTLGKTIVECENSPLQISINEAWQKIQELV